VAQIEAREEARVAPCALCTEMKTLCASHIIPNAYFKTMKRQSNGLLVMFDTHPETDVKKGSDSWWEYLLCADCEMVCGRLETAWIPRLRDAGKKFKSVEQKVPLIDFEYHSFRRFLLSVLWRSSVSKQEEFKTVRLLGAAKEYLRKVIFDGGAAPEEGVLSTRISKIFDVTGEIDIETFEHVVMSPQQFREVGIDGIRFIFAGYVVDFSMQELIPEQLEVGGYVLDQPAFEIPAIPMVDIRELMRAGLQMLIKKKSGKTRLG
jgi:hypothetical protein